MTYEINEGTLAIIANGEEEARVLEDENDYKIEQSAFEIMDKSCKYFGSSYNGRKEGSKSILGVEYKVPIVVEDSKNIIFFPTTSPYDSECIWLSLSHIKDYYQIDYNQTKVIFDNNKEIDVPISYRSIENQILRSARLESLLRNRKNS